MRLFFIALLSTFNQDMVLDSSALKTVRTPRITIFVANYEIQTLKRHYILTKISKMEAVNNYLED